MASSGSSTANQDHALQVIKKYRTYVDMIADANICKWIKIVVISVQTTTFLQFQYE